MSIKSSLSRVYTLKFINFNVYWYFYTRKYVINSPLFITDMDNLLVKKKKKNKSLKHYQNRIYDSDGYRRRVDCVLFKDASKDQVNMFCSHLKHL